MSLASLQLIYSFGLKGEVKQNVNYLDEQTIVYPAGTNLILLNTDQKTQKFLPFSQGGDGGTAMCVSPNRRYVAIAERHSEKPTVIIFDIQSMRRKKVLSCSEVTGNEYVSICFSPDSKYMITQSNGPEWMLIYWQWEKAKILASVKLGISNTGSPLNVTINQVNSTCTCT